MLDTIAYNHIQSSVFQRQYSMAANNSVEVRLSVVLFISLIYGVVSRPTNEVVSENPKVGHGARNATDNSTIGTTTVMPPTRIGKEFTLGKRVEGDSRAYQFDYLKPRRMLKPIAKVKATFPRAPYSYNPKNCTITKIHIGCPDITCYLDDDYVSILEGGIGKPNVVLRITSLNRYIYFYRVSIYTKC